MKRNGFGRGAWPTVNGIYVGYLAAPRGAAAWAVACVWALPCRLALCGVRMAMPMGVRAGRVSGAAT